MVLLLQNFAAKTHFLRVESFTFPSCKECKRKFQLIYFRRTAICGVDYCFHEHYILYLFMLRIKALLSLYSPLSSISFLIQIKHLIHSCHWTLTWVALELYIEGILVENIFFLKKCLRLLKLYWISVWGLFKKKASLFSIRVSYTVSV